MLEHRKLQVDMIKTNLFIAAVCISFLIKLLRTFFIRAALVSSAEELNRPFSNFQFPLTATTADSVCTVSASVLLAPSALEESPCSSAVDPLSKTSHRQPRISISARS